jgi:hypothetical protein
MTSDPVRNLLERLDGVAAAGERQWSARCPAHDDRRASLSVSQGDDGRALVNCHAGCKPVDVCRAAGLRVRDLFVPKERTPLGPITATYDYHDADGKVLFQVVRYANPKTFRQRRPDGKGGWIWNLDDVPRVLYRLPELLAADPKAPVFVVEGEKDVASVVGLGLVATTNPCGAGKWNCLSDDSVLLGRRVFVVPDGDERGRDHAADVAARLHGRAREVHIVPVPDGQHDVTDWIESRDALSADDLRAALLAAAEAAPVYTPPAPDDVRPAAPEALVRRLSDVDRESLLWLWPGRIPLGKLTLLAGDPGLGKSLVSLDMAARVSRGAPWPDNPLLPQTAGWVVLFNAEDDLADTIAPRLDAAGADDTRILAVEGIRLPDGGRRPFSLEEDLPRLEAVLVANPGVKLIIIDPISAFCGGVDSHKNTDVRGLLSPLAELAGRFRAAVVAVTHLSKTGGTKAVYRAMGSLAFTAAARAAWSIVKDSADPGRRLFVPAKLNLAQEPDGLAYRIVGGKVEWEPDPVKMHADDAFAAEAAAAERRSGSPARREAAEWLRNKLVGGPKPASEIIEEAEQYGMSDRTLHRALKALGGRSVKSDFDGLWMWELAGNGAGPSCHVR